MRLLATALLLTLAALVTSPPARADSKQWAKQYGEAKKALKSHDVIQWDQALSSLQQMDHPPAVLLIAKFFEEQETYEGEWTNSHSRTFLRAEAVDRVGFYAGLLRGHKSVRSLRAMVEVVDKGKSAAAPACALALERNAFLHLVEDTIRDRLRRAVRKKRTDIALQHFALLRGRLHMGDVKWVEKIVADARVDPVIRLALFEALPAYGMWNRVLAIEPAELGLDRATLDPIVAAHLGAGAELPAIGGEEAEPIVDPPEDAPWPVVHAAWQARWAALLSDGPLKDLIDLHESFVKIRYARTYRDDLYRYKSKQKQSFDKKIDDARVAARAPTIDFTHPELVAETSSLTSLLDRLHAVVPDTDVIVPPPYCPSLLELNAGAVRGAETIAFLRSEREWQTIRDDVLAYNARLRGPTDLERAHTKIVNEYRLEYDLLPLRLDIDVIDAARKHSAYCRSVGQIAHQFPGNREPHGATPNQRMINSGYPKRFVGGENVASGTPDPAEVFRMWKGSAPHRRNMLAPWWTEIGVGQSGVYWTQNFGGEPYDQDHDADD